MKSHREVKMEYVVLGVSLANLRQVPLKKFPTRGEAEDFIRAFENHATHWERIDQQSLVIVEKEVPQHIPTFVDPPFTGNPLLPKGKRNIA